METLAGVRTVYPKYDGAQVAGARVSMGLPRLNPEDIPVSLDPAMGSSEGPVLKYPIRPGDFRLFSILCVHGQSPRGYLH